MFFSVVSLLVTVYFVGHVDCLDRRVIYYSPATIGQDPHSNKIDVYTSYFSNLHRVHLPMIKALGATHVIVSDNWAADGTAVHDSFLSLAGNNSLQVIVKYSLPTQDGLSDDEFKAKTDKAKNDFLLLMKEFEGNSTNILQGYYIPAPPIEKMSTKDVTTYYQLVNDISDLLKTQEKQTKYDLIVGFPIIPRDGKGLASMIPVDATVWTIDFYTSESTFLIQVFTLFHSIFKSNIPLMPILYSDSWGVNNRSEDPQKQANLIDSFMKTYPDHVKNPVWGLTLFEFSDEW
eukprot:TRINITY_DN8804_c0_g1_i1.p1 TRINITY_DN8804_c0_g1~~TRINITY_DN8804_c0_g1_i1.p1  ORF type:complete len:289 (-),score=50.68 TRINITY_DN8804_c0_g1_i1:1239-2105(-)